MSKKVITGRDGKYTTAPKVPENETWVIVQKVRTRERKDHPGFPIETNLAFHNCPSFMGLQMAMGENWDIDSSPLTPLIPLNKLLGGTKSPCE